LLLCTFAFFVAGFSTSLGSAGQRRCQQEYAVESRTAIAALYLMPPSLKSVNYIKSIACGRAVPTDDIFH